MHGEIKKVVVTSVVIRHFFSFARCLSKISDRDEGDAGLSQMFRSFEANSGTIQRKGSEHLAKSSTPVVDHSNLGQAPRLRQELARTFVIQLPFLG